MIQIDLNYPVMIHGAQVSVFKMRRPKVRDTLSVQKLASSDAEKEVRIFANLCEVEPDVIEDLDMSDYQQLQKAWQSFLS